MQKQNKLKPFILGALAAVFIAVLAYSLDDARIVYIPEKQEQTRFEELRQLAEAEKEDPLAKYAELMEMNGDFRGWLKIKGTDIDYPVLKPDEEQPEYYLHRDFDKNYSFSGVPFIGAGADENSDSFIIYAHNMKTDTMFGTLDDYADEQWASQHRDIVFSTPKERRVYRAFAAFQTKVGADGEFKYYEKTGSLSEKDYMEFLAEAEKNAKAVFGEIPPEKTQLLMLSTCSYHTDNGRFVVIAYRTE